MVAPVILIVAETRLGPKTYSRITFTVKVKMEEEKLRVIYSDSEGTWDFGGVREVN